MKRPTDFSGDLLNLSEFSDRLEKFIEIERDFVDGSLVIALNSNFGSGKTTFLRMWKYKIEKSKPKNDRPLVINLNAWESDYYGDPLFAIISSLIESLKDRGLSAKSRPLVSAAKKVGLFGIAIGNQAVRKFTGADFIAAEDFAKKKSSSEGRDKILQPDTFSIYQGRKDAMANLKEKIKDFVMKFDPPVLFFVDELDRCRPDYAISYLETVKHIFDVDGAVFILAADKHHLENSAKKAFGSDLNFDEYYRKFVHREITLPPISESAYQRLASHYTSYYLERDNFRKSLIDISSGIIDRAAELIGVLQLTPRQIQEVFRILGHVCEDVEKEKDGKLLWGISAGTIAMIAFKISKSETYNELASQECDPDELFKFLSDRFDKNSTEWWFNIFLTGGGLEKDQGDSELDIATRLGLCQTSQDSQNGRGYLERWYRSWDRWGRVDSNRFAEIYEKIEQISKWTR